MKNEEFNQVANDVNDVDNRKRLSMSESILMKEEKKSIR